MSAKLKLLVLTPYPLWPLSSGGKIRSAKLSNHLADFGFEVTALTPYKPGQRAHFLAQHAPVNLRQVPYPPFVIAHALTDRPFPYQWLASFHPGYRMMVKRLLPRFDVIQFEHAAFADLAPLARPSCLLSYNAHNVEQDYVLSECRHRGRMVSRMVRARAHRLEESLVRRVSHVFACSNEDRNRLIDLYGAVPERVSVAPNGIDGVVAESAAGSHDAWLAKRFPSIASFARRAIFSGSNVDHNREAARRIVEQIAPRLKSWAFVIHGQCSATRRIRRGENVYYDPDLTSIDHYAHTNMIGLNPVTRGSGSNLKLLKYLSLRMPVLSTPFGLRGFPDLQRFVRVSPVEQFVDVLDKMTAVPPLEPSALTALSSYRWRTIARQMCERYHSLLDRRSDTRAS